MIGWWIVIAAQTPEDWGAANNDHKAAVLANWECSVGGIDWVTKLTQEGKATQLSSGGYPNRYTAKAGDVLPILAAGILLSGLKFRVKVPGAPEGSYYAHLPKPVIAAGKPVTTTDKPIVPPAHTSAAPARELPVAPALQH